MRISSTAQEMIDRFHRDYARMTQEMLQLAYENAINNGSAEHTAREFAKDELLGYINLQFSRFCDNLDNSNAAAKKTED